MSGSDKDVSEICSMLGDAFDKSVVEKCYFGNNCDKDRTVDFLLNLTDYEIAEIKRTINDRKVKASANKFGMLDEDDDDESISDIMPPRPPMEVRPQVYESILNTFGQELSESELRRIYLKIVDGLDDIDGVTDDDLLDTAVDQILQHLEVRNSDGTDKEGVPLITETKDFAGFCRMFEGIVKEKKLKRIWKDVHKMFQTTNATPVAEEEVSDLAIMHALDFLDEMEEKERAEIEKRDADIAASLAAEEEYVVVDNKAEYDGYEVLTEEELAFDFVQRQLPESVSAEDIKAALAHFSQDPMDAIVYLSLKVAGEIEERDFIPTSVSSDAAVAASLCASSQGRGDKRQKVVKSGAKRNHKDAKYRSVLDPSNPYNSKFTAHFVDLLKRNNPGMIARVNPSNKQVEFQGFNPDKMPETRRNNKNYDKFQASNVAVDLHGLYVQYAVQTVHSVLDYYINTCKTAEQKNAACDHNVESSDSHLYIKFIVGKGLHSKDGVAKIRPAVESYLTNERANQVDFVWLEGVILVSIKK